MNGVGDSDKSAPDWSEKWRRFCDTYNKSGNTYLDEVGPVSFFINDFLDFACRKAEEEWGTIFREADNYFERLIPLWIKIAVSEREISKDIDFSLHMVELGLSLKRKGYIVKEIGDDGFVDIVVLDENQRKQLDSIILECILTPESALKELSATERMALRDIQSEYNQMRQKMKDIKEKKLEPLYSENGFYYWPREYVLSIGHRAEDSSIETDPGSVIYTSESQEEMANYFPCSAYSLMSWILSRSLALTLKPDTPFSCSSYTMVQPIRSANSRQAFLCTGMSA